MTMDLDNDFEAGQFQDLLDLDAGKPDAAALAQWSADDVFSPWQENGELVVGTPDEDAEFHVHQQTDFTCAVVSQQMILKQFGFDISEAELVYEATINGWLDGPQGGTSSSNAAKLLELHGVDTHSHYGSDIESLVIELAHGHKVIVGVDSGEMWDEDFFFEDWYKPHGADHAIVITGIDLSDPDHPQVVINDPGKSDGAGNHYPLDKFLDAWADSGKCYVATDEAPPDLATHDIFGANYNSQSDMYFDPSYWAELLGRVVGGTEMEVGELFDPLSKLVQPQFAAMDTLDKQARNRLFESL